jgi:carbonic anhydrase/acetyltransferase-like protein (isoleucine patch superfamily)
MLMSHRGQQPVVPESAYVAPTAVVCGAVTLGENVRILHGAVVEDEVFIATGVSIFPGGQSRRGLRAADQQRSAREVTARAGHRPADRLGRGE